MAKPTTVKEAIKKFEETNNVSAADAERVRDSIRLGVCLLDAPVFTPDRIMGSNTPNRKNGCNAFITQELHVSSHSQNCSLTVRTTLHVSSYLSLSSNNIDKISSLSGMENLKVLSLGRNVIKKIENLDGVVDTMEELWMSYNQLEKLARVDC